MDYATAQRVLLPIDKAAIFQANMASSDQDLMGWRPYRFKPGETLAKVAARFDTAAYRLRQANGFSDAIIRPPSTDATCTADRTGSRNQARASRRSPRGEFIRSPGAINVQGF